MKYLLFVLFFMSCTIHPTKGVYDKNWCSENRYGDLDCDNGVKYYRAYDEISIYDE